MEKTCLVCKKVFETPDKRRKYCSTTCYRTTRVGKPFGGGLITGKGSHGKYSDFQVSQMVKGKHDAYLNRVLVNLNNHKYDIERIDNILSTCYLTNLRALCKMLIGKVDGAYTKELKYLLEYKNWLGRLCKYELPECYRVMTPEQVRWFKNVLSDCTNFYDFTRMFCQSNKQVGVRNAARLYKNLVNFIQLTGYESNALKKDLSKNLRGCGSTCESQVRQILESYKLNFIEQYYIKHSEYLVDGESIPRSAYYKPDFIVDNKFIIEVNGDYWHAWGLDESNMNSHQFKIHVRDVEKYNFYVSRGFRFIIIWEHDLVNIKNVKQRILEEVNNEIKYKEIV